MTYKFIHNIGKYLTDTKAYNTRYMSVTDAWDRLLSFEGEEATTDNIDTVVTLIVAATKRPAAEVREEVFQHVTAVFDF